MKYYRWGFNNQTYNDQFYISSGGFEKPHPKHSYGPMGRSGYMIHCITGGHGIFKSNGITYHLKEGDMFYIEPHKTTYMEADEKDPWTFYWVRFVGNLVPKYMNRINLSSKNAVMNQNDLPTVFQDVIDIVEYSKNTGPRDFYYQSKMLNILNSLQLHYPKPSLHNNIPTATDIYDRALRYISNNYEEQISVHDLVKYLNIDRSYLFRIFKKYSHTNPQDFITDYRLRKASEMLKSKENNIEYVGLSCGFVSYQSFFRFFKKKYGISPSDYKKKYLN
ncbi:AraC family transcriptional regulator [Lactobacillus hamsteri]|uniref:AraC family transcriptional regulator n=2 Tax=Lactobacillus hamsteri TaxID=96565 RepID=A0A0R1YEP5_9LACO|nr:AraC family transcriptional regulator [Lactobacillus hamsteri]KRM37491.1 AraC family transcriptional regulator [Lactobacillus hamsteri DSM 5661 = JCM 6256]